MISCPTFCCSYIGNYRAHGFMGVHIAIVAAGIIYTTSYLPILICFKFLIKHDHHDQLNFFPFNNQLTQIFKAKL